MKKTDLIMIVLLSGIFIGVWVGANLNDLNKNLPQTTYWDGETTLGNPVVVMVASNYLPKQPLTIFRSTCNPDTIFELSQELYDRGDKDNQPRHEVPESHYCIVYMFSTGSRLLISVSIDNREKVATSVNVKSHKLWEILDSISKNQGMEPCPPGFDEF